MAKHFNDFYQRYRRLSCLRKVVVWVGISFILTALLSFGASLIIQTQLPHRLKNTVDEKSHHVYSLDFDRISLSLLRGKIEIDNIILTPDTVNYFLLDSVNRNPSLFKLNVGHLRISGINILKLIVFKSLDIRSIGIQDPQIIRMKMRKEGENETGSVYEQIPQLLKGAKVRNINVNELSFKTMDYIDSLRSNGNLRGVSFRISDLLLDSTAIANPSRIWFAGDIRILSENVTYVPPDSLYKFKIKEIRGSTKDKTLTIDSFRVIPQYPELEFSRRLGKQGDRYDMVFNQLVASAIDFKKLETENHLRLRSVLLAGVSVKVFRNKSIPEVEIDKTLNFPHIAFKTLKLPVTSDTVLLKDAEVFYKELNPKSNESGTVFFTNLNGTLLNVSNDSIQWRKDNWCRSTFTANFLGKPKMELFLNLNLSDKEASFNYHGSLGTAPASFYNQLLEPLALARVDSGIIHKTLFKVNANRYGSKASVTMLYNGLKVSILGKESDRSSLDEKRKDRTAVGKIIEKVLGSKDEIESNGENLERRNVVSLLANAIVKTDNPVAGEGRRTSIVTYQHSRNKSFFNLMWKSIFTGLKDNLGVPL